MKNHLRLTGRVVRMGVEIAGIICLCFVVAWMALLWRLSQGPLEVGFLAEKLQQEISRKAEGYQVTFGSASLSWDGGFSPIQINVNNVDILRTDGTPVLHVADMGIGLSHRKLLLGQLSLKKVNIFKPAIRIIRWEDGQVTLNSEAAPVAEARNAEPAQTQPLALLAAFLNGEKIREIPAFSVIEGLRELSMTQAGILYEDRILKTTMISRSANISITRKSAEGIKARFNIIIDAPEGGVQGYVSGSYRYDKVKKVNQARISFRDINPAHIGLSGEAADIMSGIDLPLKGMVELGLQEDMSVRQASFALGAGDGQLRFGDLYSNPLPIQSIFVRGVVQPYEKTGQIERAEIVFADGPKAEATITSTAGEGDLRDIAIDAILQGMPIDKLKFYWPEKLTPDPREWVIQHLSKGVADKATLRAVLVYDPAAEQKIAPVDVGGNIDFQGIEVDYFPPLRVVTGAKGRATYDMKSFNLDITGGKLNDIIVTKSKINITGLDEQDEHTDSHIDISVDMKGPLKTALAVLDSKPLQYPSTLGIKTDGVEGQSEISVNFKFPLNKKLSVEQVQVSAKAKADQVLLKSIVAGMDISGGPMDLAVSNGALHVGGKARLGDMPVDFDWTKNFSDKTTLDMDLKADISLSPAGLQSFGLPSDITLNGNLPSSVSYHLEKNGEAQLKLSSNIMMPAISIPALNAQKPAGAPGSLEATLLLRKERLYAVRGLNMTSDALTLRGDVEFDVSGKDTALTRVNLPMVKLGNTDIMLRAQKVKNYLIADVNGRQLDASVFFPENPPPNSDEEASRQVQPLRLKMNVAKVITGEKRALEDVNLTLERNNWNRFDRVDMYGKAGGAPVTVKYLPEGAGKKLNVTAQNAGAALHALGVTKSVRGGKLTVNAKTPPGGGTRDLKGSLQIADFGLKDAPLVAKLLNAMSLSGIQDLLTGDGVQFKKAKVDFSWTDRGQPRQAQNVRLLKLKDGQTSGSSLGLTFEGTIDNWKNIYDLYGTIIPVSDINKFLNVVPLIGNVLTAGGEGIIAATYKIKGPQEQPTITVNPLAVLAPGILRKIFFE